MSKTLSGILEIAAGTVIEAIPGVGQVLGPALIQAGIATEVGVALNAIFGKSPKPRTAEPAGKPDHGDPFDALMGLGRGDEQDFGVISGFGVGRRGRDDLFEIDRHAPVIERRVQ